MFSTTHEEQEGSELWRVQGHSPFPCPFPPGGQVSIHGMKSPC